MLIMANLGMSFGLAPEQKCGFLMNGMVQPDLYSCNFIHFSACIILFYNNLRSQLCSGGSCIALVILMLAVSTYLADSWLNCNS